MCCWTWGAIAKKTHGATRILAKMSIAGLIGVAGCNQARPEKKHRNNGLLVLHQSFLSPCFVGFISVFCFFLNRKKNESFDFLGCFGQTIFLFGKPTVFPRRIRVHSVCSWWMLWSAYDTMSRRCEIQRPCSWGLESLPFSFHWMFLDRKKSWKVIVGSKWLVLTYPYFLDLSSKNPIHSHLNKKSTGRTTQASKNFGLDVKFWPKRPEVKGGRNGAFTLMACRTCLNLWWFQVNASQISAKQLGEECKNSRISILQIFQVFV